MDKEEIIKTVNTFLIREFEVEEDKISPRANLKDDLGLESLDFVDIAVLIKKKYGIKLKGRDIISIKTLGDLYDFLYDRIMNQ
ncbi:MAG: acyl carrier protein [Bacteroidales bacterium]|nr:acyl carrier protein [Bacteroidales bacterium]